MQLTLFNKFAVRKEKWLAQTGPLWTRSAQPDPIAKAIGLLCISLISDNNKVFFF